MEEGDKQSRSRARLRATYRLQFHAGFTLRDALQLVPYFAQLGVSHVYASPLLKASAGSTHCYDVCDPTQINPEIGTEADLEQLATALHERGMGLVLDIVPNHMGVAGTGNPWWWDVLKQGRASRFANFFDIDWDSPMPGLRGKVLIPVLGDGYENVLKRGELKVVPHESGAVVRYYEHQFPVCPESITADVEGFARRMNEDRSSLQALLQQQHYRLAYWREGDRVLNYRRFFNISQLAGLRVELPEVFEAAHHLALEWYRRGWVDGFRVDHPDGLQDPAGYLERLRAAAPEAWVTVEKILEPGEELPQDWLVAGTTGYDFLNRVGRVFIDPAGEEPLTRFYQEWTGEPADFGAIVRDKKRLVLREIFVPEIEQLHRLLLPLTDQYEGVKGIAPEQLRHALVELIACFPVYRTYIRAEEASVAPSDAAVLDAAVGMASREKPEAANILSFIKEVLLLKAGAGQSAEFVLRFQQLTGPAMAKGVEDTAFYCFNRFVALNEVGGDPGAFGGSVEQFYQSCAKAQEYWPNAMLTLSTHDTKRSGDVRARLALLSEIPEEWIAAVRRWSMMNDKHRTSGMPDRNAEYFFYQQLVGAWPLNLERALTTMEKAVREAKQHTSWTNQNEAYEAALKRFITGTLESKEFQQDLEKFVAPLIKPGQVNSLAQLLVTLTAPGVPDIYQGTELWDLSLVDPDNRRPVDFRHREKLLARAGKLDGARAWQEGAEGLAKLWLILRTLAFRARKPECFGAGSCYTPVYASGKKAAHVLSFLRGEEVLTVVPRLPLKLGGEWGGTSIDLPKGQWENILTAETWSSSPVPMEELLRVFPVALLTRGS